MKRFGTLLLMLVVLMAAVGIVDAQDTPVEGGTLRVAIASLTGLDPVFIADDMSMYPSSLVYQFLVRARRLADGTVAYEGDLAESWDIEEDGKVITFHLRQGMTFQDGNAVFAEGEGREVVAADVVYSMERLLNSEGTVAPSDLTSVYQSIEALDDYTVKLTLSQPDGLLFDGARGLSFLAIYPQEAVEQLGDAIRTNPIGSGPFEFVEYVVDERVVLQRNEDFYIRPLLDGVEFRIIPEDSGQVLALEADEIDIMTASVPSTDIDRFRDAPGFVLADTQITGGTQMIFNINVPLFSDVRFREAVAKAIDGRGIMRAVYGAVVVDGCGTTGPGWPGFNPDLCQYFPYEPDTSRAILAELGWADADGDGILDKDGQPLSFPIEAWNLPEMPRVMEAVVTQLREVGIDAQLEIVEFGTWIEDYFAGAEKLMPFSGFCCIGGTEAYWGPGGLGEAMGVKDEAAQALLVEALTVLDPVERAPLIMEAADMLYSQYYAIPLGFQTAFSLRSDRVQDYSGVFWWFPVVGEGYNVWLSQ
ncbi:MAG: ABC transporter substrate-binding protein [Chloroflexi bacterium]|nr:ABC transporter substrate-binding protein [Chloroflexota bacterium]